MRIIVLLLCCFFFLINVTGCGEEPQAPVIKKKPPRSASSETKESAVERDTENDLKQLFEAAKTGSIPRFRGLKAAGADLKMTSPDGHNALMYAAASGMNDAVEFLISEGISINDSDQKSGSTPLIYAATANRKETVRLLLNKGADQSISNKAGKTALLIAREKNFEQIVRLLDKDGKYWKDLFKGTIAGVSKVFVGERSQIDVPSLWRDEVFLFRGDGSDPERLTFFSEYSYAEIQGISFSRDGSRIVFCSGPDDQQMDLFVVKSSGGESSKVSDDRQSYTFPSFSHDGNRLIFSAVIDQAYNFDIYMCDLQGVNRKRLTDLMAWDGDPCLSPDSSRYVFASIRDAVNKLYIADFSNNPPARLDSSEMEEFQPCFSPDGKKLLFVTRQQAGSPFDICQMNIDGTERKLLTETPDTDEQFPTYSPDGKQIVFVSKKTSSKSFFADLIILSPDTGKTIKVSEKCKLSRISWKP